MLRTPLPEVVGSMLAAAAAGWLCAVAAVLLLLSGAMANDFYSISIPFEYYSTGGKVPLRNGSSGSSAARKEREDRRTREYLKRKYAIYEEYSFYEVCVSNSCTTFLFVVGARILKSTATP